LPISRFAREVGTTRKSAQSALCRHRLNADYADVGNLPNRMPAQNALVGSWAVITRALSDVQTSVPRIDAESLTDGRLMLAVLHDLKVMTTMGSLQLLG
jgi:aminoglycoside/choline kinase family phosphotransferase